MNTVTKTTNFLFLLVFMNFKIFINCSPVVGGTTKRPALKTMSASDINWEEISAKLPYERTPEAKNWRKELFKDFDPNGNGYLSLAEVRSLKKTMQEVVNVFLLSDSERHKGYPPTG